MEIVINNVPVRECVTFALCSKFDKANFVNEKRLLITARMVSKTRVSTTMQYKDYCVKINQEIEEFKFDHVVEKNYFALGFRNSFYFKLSKKQGKAEYLQYLTKLIPQVLTNNFGLELDKVEIDFENEAFGL